MCDQQRLRLLEYSMSVKPITEHHLEFLNLKGGCTDWAKSTLVKIPHCWKSHVAAHMYVPSYGDVLLVSALVSHSTLQTK